MRFTSRLGSLLLCAALLSSPALAQAPAPTATPAVSDACAQPVQAAKTGTGILTVMPQKNWQPPGGHIDVKLEPIAKLPPDAQIKVCFQWRDKAGAPAKGSTAVAAALHVTQVNLTNDFRARVTVPNLPPAAKDAEVASELEVPLATMRIVATNTSGILLDVSTSIGIQSQSWAFGVAFVLLLLVILLLSRFGRNTPGIQDANWFLRLIATRDGYASLSQFQVILWTVVVGFSAVYVMVLSGTLIEISQSTLGLLGIAGASTLLAQVAGAQPAAQPATLNAAPVVPVAPAPLAAPRTPRFSDLINGTDKGETIDVTRLQMLLFTLITAGFVLIKVFVGDEIPEIPVGYLILMGLSNGVYVGSKALPKS